MIWIIILFLVIALYWIHTLSKRVENLEQDKGEGYSFTLNFNFTDAIIDHTTFNDLSGIKGFQETDDWQKLNKADKEKYENLYQHISSLASLRIGYMAPTETFFVQNSKDINLVLKRLGKTGIYSQVVLGDKDEMDEYLALEIDARVIKLNDRYTSVLTAYLRYCPNSRRDTKITHLFDFPYTRTDMNDQEFMAMGFEVKNQGGDDVYTDYFGEMQGIPHITTLTKNGSKIKIVS